ncbi:hypothetical protein GOBAR_DD03573 [Gossypium barbadense]|nr:hypothetical protein GOBAR_DD03573 [Gossypium barbadense]
MPKLEAHIAEYHKVYLPNPEEVVRHYNNHFSRTMLEFYITKRMLAKSKKGPCEEKNRKKLADCAPGFARGTIGGKGGKFYVVTDCIDNAADPKPGTLLHVVMQSRQLWISFKGSMTITLK